MAIFVISARVMAAHTNPIGETLASIDLRAVTGCSVAVGFTKTTVVA